MELFKHKKLFDFKKLPYKNSNGRRLYESPSGKMLPSITSILGWFKTDKLGLLPQSVLELKTLRDEYKRRRNEAKDKREYTKWENSQMAVKRLMASFYGIIAYQGFGWANVTLAAAITASAREAIREAAFKVRELE